MLEPRIFLVPAEIPIALALRVSFIFVIGSLGTAYGITQSSLRRVWALDTSAYSIRAFFYVFRRSVARVGASPILRRTN